MPHGRGGEAGRGRRSAVLECPIAGLSLNAGPGAGGKEAMTLTYTGLWAASRRESAGFPPSVGGVTGCEMLCRLRWSTRRLLGLARLHDPGHIPYRTPRPWGHERPTGRPRCSFGPPSRDGIGHACPLPAARRHRRNALPAFLGPPSATGRTVAGLRQEAGRKAARCRIRWRGNVRGTASSIFWSAVHN